MSSAPINVSKDDLKINSEVVKNVVENSDNTDNANGSDVILPKVQHLNVWIQECVWQQYNQTQQILKMLMI